MVRRSNSIVRWIVALVLSLGAAARAEAPALALTNTGQLEITSIVDNTPAAIEITGEDIVPITWTRGGRRAGTVALLLMPAAIDPVVVTMLKQSRSIVIGDTAVARVRIDPRAYDDLAGWRLTSTASDRRYTLLLAALFVATLLMATLLRRGSTIAVTVVAVGWTVGLSIAASHQSTLFVRGEPDGSRWFLAIQPQALRVPIGPALPWMPIVASMEHLRTLSPRIVVERQQSWIELTMPTGSKVGFHR